MAIDNEELLGKFVRAGMIMRHIDGEGPRCCRHGHHHEGQGKCGMHGHDGEASEQEREERHDHGSSCCGHGHGHGHGYGHGHGEGRCHHGKRRRGQARVLTMLSMQEGISQKDLAFLLGIRPQTLGEMLQKLEERELVERKKSEVDGRIIQVYLTDEGRSRAAEIAERRSLVAADMFSVLDEAEKEQLLVILDKLGDELDKHRPPRHCKHAKEGQDEGQE